MSRALHHFNEEHLQTFPSIEISLTWNFLQMHHYEALYCDAAQKSLNENLFLTLECYLPSTWWFGEVEKLIKELKNDDGRSLAVTVKIAMAMGKPSSITYAWSFDHTKQNESLAIRSVKFVFVLEATRKQQYRATRPPSQHCY